MATTETPGLAPVGDGAAERGSSTARIQLEIRSLRRDLERWRELTGGDAGLLEALILHSPHGIIVCDPKGGFVFQNRAAEHIWAGSATIDSVDGWGVYRAFHPDGRPYGPGDWSMARCLTNREIVEAEEVHFQRFDDSHGILLGSCAPILGPRGEIEGALGVFADITAMKHVEERRHIITDSLPTLVSYLDTSLAYRFVSLAHEDWFGLPRAEIEGRHAREILGDAAFEVLEPALRRTLRGEIAQVVARVPHRLGGARWIEAQYIPHLGPDRSVLGIVGLVGDVSDRKRMEEERARWAERTGQLLEITAALAGAVTPEQVLEAVVERSAEALKARSASLWLVDDDGRAATLARSFGPPRTGTPAPTRWSLDSSHADPLLHALRTGAPVWIPPWIAHAGPGGEGAVAVLPLAVEDRRIGALELVFDAENALLREDRPMLVVVARHLVQALERVRLLREAELAYTETRLLYQLTDAVNRGHPLDRVYEAAFDAAQSALGAPAASICLFSPGQSPPFAASRGLSDAYLQGANASLGLDIAERDPRPVHVACVDESGLVPAQRAALARDGLTSLASVPLAYEGRFFGKLTLYWTDPRSLSERGRGAAKSVADQVSSAIDRKRAHAEKERLIDELSHTLRLNELFAGVVGHDLRNPLSAIMTTAQLTLRRDEGQRLQRPLRRMIAAGERMTRMIEQLLDLTRVRTGGRIPCDPREADLAIIAQRVIHEVEDAFPDCSFILDHGGDLHGVWDADRLAQVLSNLAGNAAQHGSPDAPVRLSLDGSTSEYVLICLENRGHIPPDILPVLFQPFRGAAHPGESAKGLGLGLYIVQEVVRAHGGTIEVRSTPEHGTTFTVRLPRRPAS